jgi:hypothetical protein
MPPSSLAICVLSLPNRVLSRRSRTLTMGGRALASGCQHDEMTSHTPFAGSRRHPASRDGRGGRVPCRIAMSVFPSASPSNGTMPEWSYTAQREQSEHSTNNIATYVVAHAPIRIHIVARAAHAVLEPLRRRPSQGEPVCGLGEVADRSGILESDQSEVGQPGLMLDIDEDVHLYILRNMSTRR